PVWSLCPLFGGGIAPAFRGAEGRIFNLAQFMFMRCYRASINPVQAIEVQQNVFIRNRRRGINDGGARRARCDQRGDCDAEEYPFHKPSLFKLTAVVVCMGCVNSEACEKARSWPLLTDLPMAGRGRRASLCDALSL